MATEEDDYPIQKPSKKGVIIAAAVAFLAGGGAGFGGASAMSPAPSAEDCVAEAEQVDGDAVASSTNRAIHSLSAFTVNLRGSGGGRVLRMEVQVEVEESEVDNIEDSKPRLRDATLTLASDYSYDDLEGLDGKMRFRDELMARLNKALTVPTIRRIYFTQFVVQ